MSLEFNDIHKIFPGIGNEPEIPVLEGISLAVGEGELVSFIGPSGCGKTTLLRIIAGLDRATNGRILLNGEEILEGSPKIGLVFQDYALFPWRTTLANIMIGLEFQGTAPSECRDTALEYIKLFGLVGFENRYPRELSGGMQQRVALARTLIMNPRVVLMDEPFASLDSQTRDTLQEFLIGIWQKRGETILFVTHNVEEAVYISDRIVVFSRRPARIIREFKVNFAKPRDRTGPECNALRREIISLLKREKEIQIGNLSGV